MKKLFLTMALSLLAGAALAQTGEKTPVKVFAPLPYAFDALEPHIDAKTMEIHYSRHHRGYYNNLLKALEAFPGAADRSLEELLGEMSRFPEAVRNNAGGHFNHTLFWKVMTPGGGGVPQGRLAEAIRQGFGSLEQFQAAFKQAALSRFGSGWAWLCVGLDGNLFITSTANQDNPLMDIAAERGYPILGLDVWEHAYYLKYQNQRGSYIDAFWQVVNWPAVAARLENAGR
ncbi:MAG: superoxide dismutase [Lentisphaeria bacterium]|nr:superoxide dismutase [Lentisphaeria bacterium]